MAEDNARERGSDSPGSKEAQEQSMAGGQGAQASGSRGAESQPEQGSDRGPAARHTQEPERRKGFEPGHAPSEQGEKGHPSPHVIAQHQQGIEPRSGNHAGGPDRSEEAAQSGEPAGEHTLHGRQSVGGDRQDHR